MSYARFHANSDVYVYITEKGWTVRLADDQDKYTFEHIENVIEFLKIHSQNGLDVPKHCLKDLKSEREAGIETVEDWKKHYEIQT